MKTIPGLRLRSNPKAVTEVLCPSGCGETVLRLGPEVAIAIRSVAMAEARTEQGLCPRCHSAYRLRVGEPLT